MKWLTALFFVIASAAPLGAAPRSHQLSIIDLGTLGGTFSQANAINNKNQVVGVSLTNESVFHAFSWDDGAK
jgi:probable HAF family extracellular repeat protein